MTRDYWTIWNELNKFDSIDDYTAVKAQTNYIENKKKMS
jgi:hypothetical protein